MLCSSTALSVILAILLTLTQNPKNPKLKINLSLKITYFFTSRYHLLCREPSSSAALFLKLNFVLHFGLHFTFCSRFPNLDLGIYPQIMPSWIYRSGIQNCTSAHIILQCTISYMFAIVVLLIRVTIMYFRTSWSYIPNCTRAFATGEQFCVCFLPFPFGKIITNLKDKCEVVCTILFLTLNLILHICLHSTINYSFSSV